VTGDPVTGDPATGAERPVRVLIADDHAPIRAEVRKVLEDDPRFEVCAEMADATGAVHAALRERPELCLLDVRMPGGGLSAAWEISARLPRTKIVMLTVSAEDADLFAALKAGAEGYLLKTMDLNRLPEILQGVRTGEAAIPPTLVSRLLQRFRGREPRRRQLLDVGSAERLTSREWEVLEMLVQGRSTAEIGKGLVISNSAVRAHITAIVRKLNVPDRAAAIELFRERSDI
jgi:DNA-binding NarL/FixJ family response regulator